MEPILDTYCVGQGIILGQVSEGENLTHSWSLGNGDTLVGTDLTYAYDSAGTYEIILSTTDGCRTVYDSAVVEIEEGETFDVQRQLCPGDSLTFMDSVLKDTGVYRFVGSGSGQCDSIFLVTITQLVRDTVDREVEICPGIAIELYGQSFEDVDTLQLTIPGQLCDTIVNLALVQSEDCPCLGEFPNAFTPNSDGMNDTYGMFPIKDGCNPLDLDNFEMNVYNRWGQKLFSTKDIEEKWDGRFKGEDCVSDVYLVSYSYDYEGTTKSKSIDVTLVR
jgi:gliding motility-associated-like protein